MTAERYGRHEATKSRSIHEETTKTFLLIPGVLGQTALGDLHSRHAVEDSGQDHMRKRIADFAASGLTAIDDRRLIAA
jgi:hypothetical protein